MPSTAGRLLIAEPMLDDPNFERTVVLVVEHTEEGALGLVLNRSTDLAVADVVPAWRELASEPAVVHVGGPVEGRSGWCLARLREPAPRPGFVPVVGDLGLVDLSLDPAELAGQLTDARLYAGYSGWGPGQLDGELALDSWFVVDARPGDPFHQHPDQLWREVLARQKGGLGRLSNFPPDPSLN
ncbi:MAG: YqgE/AlgH family protein [Acidimicrobiia bacterium]